VLGRIAMVRVTYAFRVDVDAGKVATISADEVFARLEQRFGGK